VSDDFKAATPIAVVIADCGDPAASSMKLRVALRVPLAVGAKLTETEQVAAGASDDPQVLVI